MPYIEDGRKLIRHAYQHGFALPAFNFCSLEMAQGCIQAAEMLQAPIILQIYQADLRFASPKVAVAMVKSLAEEVSVPVMLHLDHGLDWQMVLECLEAGFSSVMLDGGKMDFTALLESTQKLSVIAHDYNAALEVSAERFNLGESEPTNPLEALQLLEIGADMIACSVGSEHGQASRLNLGLLESIAKTVNAPLVLHGGSGIDLSDLMAAKNLGVVKVNIGSAIYRSLRQVWYQDSSRSHREVYSEARDAICETAKHFISLLGADQAPAWRDL